jgi:hypothetical protein
VCGAVCVWSRLCAEPCVCVRIRVCRPHTPTHTHTQWYCVRGDWVPVLLRLWADILERERPAPSRKRSAAAAAAAKAPAAAAAAAAAPWDPGCRGQPGAPALFEQPPGGDHRKALYTKVLQSLKEAGAQEGVHYCVVQQKHAQEVAPRVGWCHAVLNIRPSLKLGEPLLCNTRTCMHTLGTRAHTHTHMHRAGAHTHRRGHTPAHTPRTPHTHARAAFDRVVFEDFAFAAVAHRELFSGCFGSGMPNDYTAALHGNYGSFVTRLFTRSAAASAAAGQRADKRRQAK